MKAINATEAKKKLLELIREADETFERYLILRNGLPKAILMSVEEFDSWLETIEILSSPTTLKEIAKARKELERGKGIPFEKILRKLSA